MSIKFKSTPKNKVEYYKIPIGGCFKLSTLKLSEETQESILIKTDHKGVSGTLAIRLTDGVSFSFVPNEPVEPLSIIMEVSE